MNKPIGKLMYIGKSSKEDLINGKTYGCFALSFGYVQVIDESGEKYWYSAINPAGDQCEDHSVWTIVEDESDNKLLTEFVLGNKSRTEKDRAEEQGKVLATISFETVKKSKFAKQKRIIRSYVEETPERKKYRDKQLSMLAEFMARHLYDNVKKYNGMENYIKTFDSQPGDAYEYDFNGKKYKVIKNEKSWSVYRIYKEKKIFVERVSLNQCQRSMM